MRVPASRATELRLRLRMRRELSDVDSDDRLSRSAPAAGATLVPTPTKRSPTAEEAMELDLLDDDDDDDDANESDDANEWRHIPSNTNANAREPAPKPTTRPAAIDAERDALFMEIVLAKRPCDATGDARAKVWDDVATAFVAAGGAGMASGMGATNRWHYLTTVYHTVPADMPSALRVMVRQYMELERHGKKTVAPRRDLVRDELFMKIVLQVRPSGVKGAAKHAVWKEIATTFMAAGGNRMTRATSGMSRVRCITQALLDHPHTFSPSLRALVLAYHEQSDQSGKQHEHLLETLRQLATDTTGELVVRSQPAAFARSSGSATNYSDAGGIERADEDLVRLVIDTRPWLASEPERWLWQTVADQLLETVDKLPDGRPVCADAVQERFAWLRDVLKDMDHPQHTWLSPAMRTMLTEYTDVPNAILLCRLKALYKLKPKSAVGRIRLVRQSLDDVLLRVILGRMSRADQGMPAWWYGVARAVNARVGATVFTTLGGSTKRRTRVLLERYRNSSPGDALKPSVRDKLRKLDGTRLCDEREGDASNVQSDQSPHAVSTSVTTARGSGSTTGDQDIEVACPKADQRGQVPPAKKRKSQLMDFFFNRPDRPRSASETAAFQSSSLATKASRHGQTPSRDAARQLLPATSAHTPTPTKKRTALPAVKSPVRLAAFVDAIEARLAAETRPRTGSSRAPIDPTVPSSQTGTAHTPTPTKKRKALPTVGPPVATTAVQALEARLTAVKCPRTESSRASVEPSVPSSPTETPLIVETSDLARVETERQSSPPRPVAPSLVSPHADLNAEVDKLRETLALVTEKLDATIGTRTQTTELVEQLRLERHESRVQQQALLELLKIERERHQREIQSEREAQRRELQAERDARERETRAMQDQMDRERRIHRDELVAMTQRMTRLSARPGTDQARDNAVDRAR